MTLICYSTKEDSDYRLYILILDERLSATSGGTAPSCSTALQCLALPTHICRSTAAAFSFPLWDPLSTTSTSDPTAPSSLPTAAHPSPTVVRCRTAPAATILALFSWHIERLKSAVAASFFPRTLPFPKSSTSARTAPDRPIFTRYSSISEMLKRVAAAFSRAIEFPVESTWMSGSRAPWQAIRALMLSLIERLRRAVTACSCTSRASDRRREMSGPMARFSSMMARFSRLCLARRRSSRAHAACLSVEGLVRPSTSFSTCEAVVSSSCVNSEGDFVSPALSGFLLGNLELSISAVGV
ncbi:GC-rich sequence DNA-binding factor 2 [Striga asiatica]|uniref:GC-rich sequence DNA-binding factor 2 n=1 Tax=Striga asiatica TaxID=4170 RepID=A0A5A7NXB1_STRAF|nr:GC-rich sequence DNA-binding factor 2 [Striga asiatica]